MAELTERWSFVSTADGPAIRHAHSCVVCCKRKRDRCHVCNGTGIRTVDRLLDTAELQRLSEELAALLTSTQTATG